MALNQAANVFGGATITRGYGVYVNRNHQTVSEPTLIFDIIDLHGGNPVAIDIFADYLQSLFNQESVICIQVS